MIDGPTFLVFLAAAFTLAVLPGPGMFYVLARTLHGGRREGILSTVGTAIAGLVHTVAAALGVSAILATSATAFAVVKWAGVAYLIYLGVRTLLDRHEPAQRATEAPPAPDASTSRGGALRQGIVAEVLNPKTALFFLSFLPQFVTPDGAVFAQFVLLGAITTLLTSGVDLAVAFTAAPLSKLLVRSRGVRQVQRYGTGGALIALGVYVARTR